MYSVFYCLLIILMVAIDQISKYLIVHKLTVGQNIDIIDNFFSITYLKNYGAGFSILQNQTLLFCILGFFVVIFLGFSLIKKENDIFTNASYLMIIGGTIGNLIDRVSYHYVVDFLDFIIFGYDFPVFNVADCFITIGCFLLIISVLAENKNA